jgi:DNA-binding transcriptional LysR family regulator
LTSSAVSQQLSVLEREAGTSLIDRSSRGVSLTGAGHALVVRAEELIDVLTSARADLDRISGAVSGPVALASVASAAATFVSAAARTLRETHSGIAVSVVAAEPSHALDLLVAGDVDLAVVDEYDYVPLALPDFVVATELCVEPLVVLTSAQAPTRPRRHGVALVDLANESWVMPPDYAACGHAVRAACRAAGFEPAVRWETDDMLLLIRAVADGHGVAVLPRLSLAADDAVRVHTSPLGEPPMTRRLMAVARASSLTRPVVSVVLDAVGAAAGRT